MSDISKIEYSGEVYDIADQTARADAASAQTTATETAAALSPVNEKVNTLTVDQNVPFTRWTPTDLMGGSVWLNGCWYARKNNVVTVSIAIAGAIGQNATIFNLPAALRPPETVRFRVTGNEAGYTGSVTINSNGNIVCTVDNLGLLGTITYIV